MQCDLKKVYGDLAAKLPATFDGNDEITFSAQNLPAPPAGLTSDCLYIRKGTHEYPYAYRVDSLDLYARKEFYTDLGLLFLSVVLNPVPPEVTVKLTHPASDVRSLKIKFSHEELQNLPPGYHTRPHGFVYYPGRPGRHPFDGCVNPQELPCFGLTNAEDIVATGEDYLRRNTVICFGSDQGLVRFAELLLNAGQAGNTVSEYDLEGEGGFRGVGMHSAEVRLWLPGSDFWEESQWAADQ